MDPATNALSLAGPESQRLYKQLLTALRKIGPFEEDVKKTSIHLVHGSAFAGVHPRKQHLTITIKSAKPRSSSRISKSEQVSKSRWHLDVRLSASKEIDPELLSWLREAYELCAAKKSATA
jgi:Domain of unknown function (DUF5655)